MFLQLVFSYLSAGVPSTDAPSADATGVTEPVTKVINTAPTPSFTLPNLYRTGLNDRISPTLDLLVLLQNTEGWRSVKYHNLDTPEEILSDYLDLGK